MPLLRFRHDVKVRPSTIQGIAIQGFDSLALLGIYDRPLKGDIVGLAVIIDIPTTGITATFPVAIAEPFGPILLADSRPVLGVHNRRLSGCQG